MKSRAFPAFGHGYGHTHRATMLFEALGLRANDAKLITTFDNPGVWLLWTGSNGERYRHKFEDGLVNIDDDEIAALKIKVRLSTC